MQFHESYGTMPKSTLDTIKACNVSPADWDDMLMRWGHSWGDTDLYWPGVENHILTHSSSGSYRWPLYG